MRISQEKKTIEITDGLLYNSDFSDVVTIEENKFRVIVNTICFTKDLNQAAKELGISIKYLYNFCGKHNICNKKREVMRNVFALSGIKIKLRYNHGKQKDKKT